MKACYVEVFKENQEQSNLYFCTQPTSPKEALAIADNLALIFARTFKDPVFYRDEKASNQSSKNGVEINVWELAKDEDDLDINQRHIIIKERK